MPYSSGVNIRVKINVFINAVTAGISLAGK
jgi:hypothetical protein